MRLDAIDRNLSQSTKIVNANHFGTSLGANSISIAIPIWCDGLRLTPNRWNESESCDIGTKVSFGCDYPSAI